MRDRAARARPLESDRVGSRARCYNNSAGVPGVRWLRWRQFCGTRCVPSRAASPGRPGGRVPASPPGGRQRNAADAKNVGSRSVARARSRSSARYQSRRCVIAAPWQLPLVKMTSVRSIEILFSRPRLRRRLLAPIPPLGRNSKPQMDRYRTGHRRCLPSAPHRQRAFSVAAASHFPGGTCAPASPPGGRQGNAADAKNVGSRSVARARS
jgi:hypothetical protein